MKEVVFEFPTSYEDTGLEGDELWNELMPCRIPYHTDFGEYLFPVGQWDPDLYAYRSREGLICHRASPSQKIQKRRKSTRYP
jgi:hypothetical protein